MKMDLRCCLNPKVIGAALVAVLGLWLLAPGLAARAVPLLITAICPLSMLIMVWGMARGQGTASCATSRPRSDTGVPEVAGQSQGSDSARRWSAEHVVDLQTQLEDVQARRRAIVDQIARLEAAGGPVADGAGLREAAAPEPAHGRAWRG
jgi:hypothetical protein